jgi:hypothetical protein
MFDVYINGERHGSIAAANYKEARKVARAIYGRRVDVVGGK